MSLTEVETRYAVGPNEVKGFDTNQLRNEFLVDKLMQPNQVYWVYSHYERFMVGSAVPTVQPLQLETLEPLKAATFLHGRELGVINVGGQGTITVDGTCYSLNYQDALYIGKDNQQVIFASDDAATPAKFYLNSAPAHHAYPTQLVTKQDANVLHLGSLATSNERDIRQMLISTVVKTCQLQMGLTALNTGSVWNTMPAHQHDRRNEVYFYFEVPESQAVCHFMGQPQETRHIWVHNEQAVISPPWSIHAGSGTQNYSFIWGMAGENLDYDDMDKYQPNELR
ncbi:5-dehydro-4-deoxy-D-glucuronate isomerase [Shewanella sp. UCD-KL21]|uniref:5-dehydro-4-deoxy-D-glucuronate isomerase n=1 Tax=Shewanella sp. UCD-KL21 TaxID=1917164 RepID=UPI0009708BE6|nr:5-dehydro-4-deoxy-D-glucuronate isomerase [Shewanella sp. UCD-KL21]